MYQQPEGYAPIADSLGISALVAAIPLVLLFVLLGALRMPAQWASLISLLAAVLIAIFGYGMPVDQTAISASEGAVFGFYPIMWIVINAIWVYNMTAKTGHFAVLRRSFGTISDDQRVQAIIIAFLFGALLEALAGFGTPVAITAVMLIALGFQPIKAAAVALVANTAPVAFGAIAVPITTLAELTGLEVEALGAMVGRQTPFLALVVPLILVGMVDGGRGIRQTWPAALVGGLAFAVGQFLCSNFFSVALTDIVAALVGTGALVLFLRVWSPGETIRGEAGGAHSAAAGAEGHDPRMEAEIDRRDRTGGDSRREVLEAYAPYLVIIVVFSLAQLPFVKSLLRSAEYAVLGLSGSTEEEPKVAWPGLNVMNPDGEPVSSAMFTVNVFEAAGTLMLLAGILTALVLRVRPGRALETYGETLNQLKGAILTVVVVLALAYVMNQSAQTLTLGTLAAQTGGFFAMLSPLLGWLGVAVTGSDTSSNSLFGALQIEAASGAGLSPLLMAAANSSGGVLGKMISPQNLAIGAAAVGMAGQEGDLFRRVLGWSLLLVAIMCVLVFLQSTPVLDWMVPETPAPNPS
ncbi:MAG: L-lactate permease [Thermoleophilaceae bacterium]